MLKKALKLDQVHTFGDISKSQLVEKFDLMTEFALFNQLNSLQPDSQTLIIIISLAYFGTLTESDKEHKRMNEGVLLKIISESKSKTNQEIPASPDFT